MGVKGKPNVQLVCTFNQSLVFPKTTNHLSLYDTREKPNSDIVDFRAFSAWTDEKQIKATLIFNRKNWRLSYSILVGRGNQKVFPRNDSEMIPAFRKSPACPSLEPSQQYLGLSHWHYILSPPLPWYLRTSREAAKQVLAHTWSLIWWDLKRRCICQLRWYPFKTQFLQPYIFLFQEQKGGRSRDSYRTKPLW